MSPAGRADLVVIDEVSMVDKIMADDLRSFGCKILVLGDVNGQLPPVQGAGAFTNREPDFRLTEPNRFALESPIIRLAMKARRNERIEPMIDGSVEVVILDNYSWRAVESPSTQVLCGIHRTRWGVSGVIRRFRGFDGPLPAPGERVVATGDVFINAFCPDMPPITMGMAMADLRRHVIFNAVAATTYDKPLADDGAIEG